MLGVLFAVWIMPGLRRSRETESCPARGCPFVGPPRSLTVHWRSFHEEMVVLYMCPLPECSWQTFKPQNLRQHWENYHHAAKHQSLALRTLPLLAEFVRNRHRTDPGDCRPPVLPVQRPMGSLPHDSKDSLLVQVQRILNDPGTPTPGTSSLVAPPSQPVPLPIVSRAMPRCDQNPSAGPSSLVVPSCLPGPLPGTPQAPHSEDQRVVVEETPSLVAEVRGNESSLSPSVIPATPIRKPQTPFPFQGHSPIVIDTSPSSTPEASPAVSPAFTALSTPTLSVMLSNSPSIHGSPILPPVTSPGPDRDPVLGGLFTELVPEPPQPSRSLLNEFTPMTPSTTLPRFSEVPKCKTTASATTSAAPSEERQALIERLQQIDGQKAALDVERVDVVHHLTCQEGEGMQRLRQELAETQQRCHLLESQLARLRSSSDVPAEFVGSLQSICTSHALLLLPDRGHTSVYHLTQRDLVALDLSDREPALSCERL